MTSQDKVPVCTRFQVQSLTSPAKKIRQQEMQNTCLTSWKPLPVRLDKGDSAEGRLMSLTRLHILLQLLPSLLHFCRGECEDFLGREGWYHVGAILFP